MGVALFANNAAATLASGITSGALSLTLTAGQGALFPSPTGGDYFCLTLTQAGFTETSWEIVHCTGRVGDVLTIVRGQEGTTAAAWASGDKAELRWTAGSVPQAGSGLTNTNQSLAVTSLPNDTLMSGDLLAQVMAAPATPGAGFVRVWTDSTTKILTSKDDTGVVAHVVRTYTGGANQFVTAINADGSVSHAQVLWSNLGGTATGDLTGAMPNPTVFQAHLTDQAAPATPASGTLVLYSFNQQGFSVPHVQDPQGNAVEITRDNFTVVRNTTGSTINRGVPVYQTGTTGAVPTVAPAKADSATTMPALGITYDTMAPNAYGRMLVNGNLESIDMSAFANGNTLYVSDTTAGALTATKPTYPSLAQRVGTVLNNGVGNGVLQCFAHLPEIPLLPTATFLGRTTAGTGAYEDFAASVAFTMLGLGTMATQNATSVAITGGAIDGTPIGQTTKAAGSFTSVTASSSVSLSVSLNGSNTFQSANTSNGTAAVATFTASNDAGVSFQGRAYGSGNTATAFGLTLANYVGFFGAGASLQGILIGQTVSAGVPIIFGLGTSIVGRFTSGTLTTGAFHVYYTGDATSSTAAGTILDGGLAVAKTLWAATLKCDNALAVLYGGTGTTTATGTAGSVVLSVSPALTGTPTVPTASAGTATTQAASTAFVQNAIGQGTNGQPLTPFAFREVWFIRPSTSPTTNVPFVSGLNISCVVTTGTVTMPAITTSSLQTSARHINYLGGSGTNLVGGIVSANPVCWRGNAAQLGGFYGVWRFSQETNLNGSRAFYGLSTASTQVGGSAEPSASSNHLIGVGFDAADSSGADYFFYHGDGTTMSHVSVGASMARDTTTVWELVMWCLPNDSQIWYRITNLTTGTVIVSDTSVSSNIPAAADLLYAHHGMSSGTQSSQVKNDLYLCHVEVLT